MPCVPHVATMKVIFSIEMPMKPVAILARKNRNEYQTKRPQLGVSLLITAGHLDTSPTGAFSLFEAVTATPLSDCFVCKRSVHKPCCV